MRGFLFEIGREDCAADDISREMRHGLIETKGALRTRMLFKISDTSRDTLCDSRKCAIHTHHAERRVKHIALSTPDFAR